MSRAIVVDSSGRSIDEVMLVRMEAGNSYTGLDQVEIFCHGGQQVLRKILDIMLRSPARAAEPGEFTRLAFLNGRIDLSRAEAVAEMVRANTDQSYEAAREHLLGAYSDQIEMLRKQIVAILAEIEASIDYPEEEIPESDQKAVLRQFDSIVSQLEKLSSSYRGGRIVKEGFRIVIAGQANVGKSTLFNLLLRKERALVSSEAGTTRDYLSEWIDLGGYAVNLIDTAGWRHSNDEVERAGQVAASRAMSEADLIVWVSDLTEDDWQFYTGEDELALQDSDKLYVGNKLDLLEAHQETGEQYFGRHDCPSDDFVDISCVTGHGIDRLRELLLRRIQRNVPDLTSGQVVTSARHHQKMELAVRSLRHSRELFETGVSPEMVSVDLRQAADSLAEITGKIYTEDILEQVFSKFCIGK